MPANKAGACAFRTAADSAEVPTHKDAMEMMLALSVWPEHFALGDTKGIGDAWLLITE